MRAFRRARICIVVFLFAFVGVAPLLVTFVGDLSRAVTRPRDQDARQSPCDNLCRSAAFCAVEMDWSRLKLLQEGSISSPRPSMNSRLERIAALAGSTSHRDIKRFFQGRAHSTADAETIDVSLASERALAESISADLVCGEPRTKQASELPPRELVVVFPANDAVWERDFLIDDVVRPAAAAAGIFDVTVVPTTTFEDGARKAVRKPASQVPHVLVLHAREWSVAHNASGTAGTKQGCTAAVCTRLKELEPSAVILVSDEALAATCVDEAVQLCKAAAAPRGKELPLYWRQYAAAGSSAIPLGFVGRGAGAVMELASTRLPLTSRLHPKNLRRSSVRMLAWSFIGRLKGERAAVIDHAVQHSRTKRPSTMTAHFVSTAGDVSSEAAAQILAESVFAISPKGFVSLDCFRHHEAARAGAIPVVVSSRSAAQQAFGHYVLGGVGDCATTLPPWLFAPDWDTALERMATLLDPANSAELDALQQRGLRWWFCVIGRMRSELAAAIHP